MKTEIRIDAYIAPLGWAICATWEGEKYLIEAGVVDPYPRVEYWNANKAQVVAAIQKESLTVHQQEREAVRRYQPAEANGRVGRLLPTMREEPDGEYVLYRDWEQAIAVLGAVKMDRDQLKSQLAALLLRS